MLPVVPVPPRAGTPASSPAFEDEAPASSPYAVGDPLGPQPFDDCPDAPVPEDAAPVLPSSAPEGVVDDGSVGAPAGAVQAMAKQVDESKATAMGETRCMKVTLSSFRTNVACATDCSIFRGKPPENE